MSEVSYITEEGLKKLLKEVDHLTGVERPAISKQIAEARDKGDLSENAEYAAAKEAQGLLELKISKLNDAISKARIIDESQIDISTVQILTKVKLRNKQNNQIAEYRLVSESEADLKANKLTVGTRIAKGLIEKKAGDEVEIKVLSCVMQSEIVEISR